MLVIFLVSCMNKLKKNSELSKEQIMLLIEETKTKNIEILSIFVGITAFIQSSVGIMGSGTHSLFEKLILMLGLSTSLVLFVLLIDLVIMSKFSNTAKNTNNKVLRYKIAFLISIIVAFLFLLYLSYPSSTPQDIINCTSITIGPQTISLP